MNGQTVPVADHVRVGLLGCGNVGASLVRLVDDESLRGPVNVVGPNPCTMQQFAETLGRVLRRPSFFRVPRFAARLVVGKGAVVVLTGQRALPKRLGAAGFAWAHPELEECLSVELGS